MNIAGLQKMTLLDFPGKVACTVFLDGCNFRCPFCHNSPLLGSAPPEMTDEALLAFLEKRKGLLDGVCITGGEPTLSPELPELLRRIRALGYPVKLDTNGSRPEVLKALVREGLVQYVAMDIKNSPARYARTVGLKTLNLEPLEQSIRFLLSDAVDYELRTTVALPLHDADAIRDMGVWLESLGGKPKRFYLQNYVNRESVLAPAGLSPAEKHALQEMLAAAAPYVRQAAIRGES